MLYSWTVFRNEGENGNFQILFFEEDIRKSQAILRYVL